jgi:hypothetical protein|tara:strand:+ start:126 stop:278 length:153 start_codon:yes stop_codon:yes gene_type:complete
MLDLEQLVNKLEEAIELAEWDLVEEVTDVIRIELDNPFHEYEADEDIEDF